MRESIARSLLVATVLATLAACAAGPEFRRPEPDVPAAYASNPQRLATGSTGALQPQAHGTPVAPADALLPEADARFWQRLQDPVLDELVLRALRENHDLRIAAARFDEANALLRQARFDTLPTVTATAGASRTLPSADQMPGVPRSDRDVESYDASVIASWELDLFGRVRRGVESQRADAAAIAADLAAAQVAIVGEVVRTYIELRGLQERLRIARRNAENQRETLHIVQARLDAGRGTEFDTARVSGQLETTLARIPPLAASVDVSMHRLAILTGQSPGSLLARLDAVSNPPMPQLPPGLVQAGTPGELLRRRPDIAAAEHRLHAATARIGVATADLFPRFTLAGLIGTQALDTGALFEGDAETRYATLGVDWSFLDVGRVRARIAASDAAATGALAQYERTVLRALEETENALVRLGHARTEEAHLARAAVDGHRAAELARIRFDAGAADLLEVLDAERTRLQAEDAAADALTRSGTALVTLYESLAGGWSDSMPRRERVSAR